jgi:curved DNA-binding protein CbpA
MRMPSLRLYRLSFPILLVWSTVSVSSFIVTSGRHATRSAPLSNMQRGGPAAAGGQQPPPHQQLERRLRLFWHTSRRWRSSSPLFMASNPDFASNNPFQVLGLTDTANPISKADVKRAYRKLAMQYHPDVAVTADKEISSARFAKINAAYREVLERLERGETSSSSSSRQKTTTASPSSGGSTWEPPHRRSGAYRGSSTSSSSSSSSSSPYASTDWRDYMPKKEDDAQYDTNGDSFEKIFSDMFARGASGSVTFVSDFLDFFENNFDGYKSSSSSSKMPDDPDLQAILREGSVVEVKAEMEETELVVRQLTTKLGTIRQELDPLRQSQSQAALRYSERVQNQERIAELEAQRTVVDGYVTTAQRRLLALQNRYKEMKQQQQQQQGSSSSGRASSSSTWNDARTAAAAGSSSTSGASTNSNSNPASSNPNSGSSAQDESWKSEGFGTSGRRGSRRSRTTTATTPSEPSSSPSTASSSSSYSSPQQSYNSPPRSERPPSSSSSSSATISTTASNSDPTVPPHRRPAGTRPSYRDKVENERRLREIKVDEEFEKLKSELGLS